MKDYFNTASPVRFVFPIDGDCLNIYDGEMKNGFLTIKVKVQAPAGADLWINERKAAHEDGLYTLEVPLKGYSTTIVAENRVNGYQTKITVYMLDGRQGCVNKFRISLDDNILFLADLTRNKDVYKSMLENPYLAVYKKAHDLYGAKVHINIYYEYCDGESDRKTFSSPRDYFNLTMMTDKYKPEWEANSDWLKLSFHARSNTPDRPYLTTSYARLDNDLSLVHREILRFAGPKSLSSVTTLHWGASNETGVHVLHNHGYMGLNGYFKLDSRGDTLVSYFYPVDLVEHFDTRDFWVDNEEHIVYSKVDMVLNSYKLEQVVPELEAIYSRKHNAGFVELLIHEQYFYPDYVAYIPKYEEIVLTAAKWLSEHGYTGSHLSEVMFEKQGHIDLPEA